MDYRDIQGRVIAIKEEYDYSYQNLAGALDLSTTSVWKIINGIPLCNKVLERIEKSIQEHGESGNKVVGKNYRKCLKCDNLFLSKNNNRLCYNCKVRNSEIFEW